MRVIILAAGQGTRLRPLTNDKPKCMVELYNKPLIEYQLDLFKECEINDINIITGYLEDKINYHKTTKYFNKNYKNTNMVASLFCASELFDGTEDILISYGDIIYNKNVLNTIMDSQEKISIVVDKEWKRYWAARMDNPLEDAETLKINKEGYIKELGKVAISYKEIEGQYIGLVKIRKDVVKNVRLYYEKLDKNVLYDSKNFDNMYMTSFLQLIADNLIPLSPVYINNGWMEVDCASDLNFKHFVDNN